MWLFAPNISCNHGFSSRHGGISKKPFDSLNLGGHEDNIDDIKINQQIALKKLKLNTIKLAFLNQVHGNEVKIAINGCQLGDALVLMKIKLHLLLVWSIIAMS
jgi:copper oxidase (laccase) domain-containing protein